MRRDQAFKEDVLLNPQQVRIPRRPQTTYIILPALET